MEGEDQGSSQGAGTRLVQDQTCLRDNLLRRTWEEGGVSRSILFFVWKTTDTYLAFIHVHMLIISCCSLEGQIQTPSAGAERPFNFSLSIKFE